MAPKVAFLCLVIFFLPTLLSPLSPSVIYLEKTKAGRMFLICISQNCEDSLGDTKRSKC